MLVVEPKVLDEIANAEELEEVVLGDLGAWASAQLLRVLLRQRVLLERKIPFVDLADVVICMAIRVRLRRRSYLEVGDKVLEAKYFQDAAVARPEVSRAA